MKKQEKNTKNTLFVITADHGQVDVEGYVEIYKDKEEFGSYKKEVTLDIDAPVTDESKTLISDILRIEDETENELDTNESYLTFKEGLYKLLDGVKSRDKNIFLKKNIW